MHHIIVLIRAVSITSLVCSLFVACGTEETTQAPDMGVLDRGPLPDAARIDQSMPKPDAETTIADLGVPDQGMADPAYYIPYGQCPDEVDFAGQLQGPGAPAPNGGVAIFEDFDRSYDANLETLYARLPARTGSSDPQPVTVDVAVSRVTVVATRPRRNAGDQVFESKGRFWVADGRRTIEVFLPLSTREVPTFDVVVGQVISFRAQTIGWYGLRAQIQKATDFILHEDGPAHSTITQLGAVSVLEPERDLSVSDIPKMVRVTGLLEGSGDACGGDFYCWSMADRPNLIYRTPASDLRAGTCITFVGPVSGFGQSVQLEAFNPAWVRRYQQGAAFEEICATGSDCASGVCVSLGEDKFCSMACESNTDCPLRYTCTFDRCLPSFGGVCPDLATYEGQYNGLVSEGPQCVEDLDCLSRRICDEQSNRCRSEAPDGGRFTLAPYPEDFEANIATLLAQAPSAAVADPSPVTTEIPITGAVVTSTHSGDELIGPDTERQSPASQFRFTLADGKGSVEVYLDIGGGSPPFRVRTGMVVSLVATQLDRFQGKVQIRRATWAPHDPNQVAHPEVGGGTHAFVSTFEPDRAFLRSDLSRIVRVMGTLEGAGDRCGGDNRCWTLNYGYGEPVVVRTSNPAAYTGACVTFIGPLGYYNGNYQLDVVNPAWLTVSDGEE